MPVYYGRYHNTYVLKDTPVASGGEGSVYEIEGKSNLVAKLYHDKKFTPLPNGENPRQYLQEKILTMLDQPVSPYVGSGTNQALTVAWPQDILMDSHGVFAGYTMPRVNSRYHIYAASRERERKQLYPNYTWKTAVIIAYNLAFAVKIVHSTNAVIGDFNTNNIMLDNLGHVTLIDTDSFNITNQRTGKVYKCTVGVAENLPPELQGKNLAASTSIFTQQTDNFALAIHIFSLLMNNCHPFSCSSMNQLQSSASGNPAARNIVQGNCPYVSNGRGTPAAAAPDIMMLPPELRQLFERAFAYDVYTAVQAATIARRPSAEEWLNALQRLLKTKFAVCRNPSHVYPPHNRMCPWCVVDLFRNAAEPGYTEAQYQLGLCYEKGVGVTKDAARAASWYNKAAGQGLAAAQDALGRCYENGTGVSQDYTLAVEWYRKAAEQGLATAQDALGRCYENGMGVSQDYTLAVEWYRKAAEQDFTTAQYNLGLIHEKHGFEIHYQEFQALPLYCRPYVNSPIFKKEAAEWYRKAAVRGHTDALYRLGMVTKEEKWLRMGAEQGHEDAQDALVQYYYDNWDKGIDDTQAVFWFRKLAERDEPYALAGLGLCCYEGKGVKQDYDQAVSWWRKATSAATKGKHYNLTNIQFRLGECYENGVGVLPDCAQAAIWYKKAAKSEEAQYHLGLLYYEGRGVKQDYAQAVTCWKSAVSHAGSNPPPFYAQATFYLGECHEKGLGVKQNFREAAGWYRSAAKSGHAQAAYRLAALYEENRAGGVSYVGKFGRTAEDHLNRAAEWYRKAAELGVDGAQQALKRVERKIRWRW